MMMAAVEQPARGPRTSHEMQDYTAETFLPHVGLAVNFEIPCEEGGPAGQLQLQLLEVLRPQHGSRPTSFREPFSLLFTVMGGQPSDKGLHRIAHEDFAPCDWLLTRVSVPGKDPRVAYYEAVFG